MFFRLPRPHLVFLACVGYLLVIFFLACVTIFSLSLSSPPSYPDYTHVENAIHWPLLEEALKSANSTSLVRECSLRSCRKYCSFSQSYRVDRLISHGWTKSVFQVTLSNGTKAALKVVHTNGEDVNQCLKILSGVERKSAWLKCVTRAASKLHKEIRLLQSLNHPGVSKVLSYCNLGCKACEQFPGSVALLTELGEPVTNLKLLQLPLGRRLKLVSDLAELLSYLSTKSLTMLDYRLRQFVIIGEKLVLSDVDDVSETERSCHNNSECHIHSHFSVNCVENVCKGLSDRSNVYKAGQEFIAYLLLGVGAQGDELRRAYMSAEFSPTISQLTKTLLLNLSAITKV